MSDPESRGDAGGEEIHASSQVILDGNLSAEKLLSLIRVGREEEALSYKSSYDLSGKTVEAFREGDVWVRSGSSSVRADQPRHAGADFEDTPS